MGIQARIVLYAPNEDDAKAVARDAFGEMDRLEAILSDYRIDSEVMDLSRASGTGPRAVSKDLYDILKASVAISEASDGAFDVTMGPVVRLWRTARRDSILPSPEAIRDALSKTGWRHIHFGPPWLRTVELGVAGMQLDFGGIGKGWAADAASRILHANGAPRHLVDLGGDLVLGDAPPDKEGWTIEVMESDDPDHEAPVLMLSNSAIATSGDLSQFIELDGVRYSHIVDPRTGMGLTNRLEVTVIARTGHEADALASSVSVLGPAQGLALLTEFPGAVGRITSLEDSAPRTVTSPGFPASHLP